MTERSTEIPDSTAVRTALWRALHVEVDDAPPVVDDRIGLELIDPPAGWRQRPDMDPIGTRGFRAAIVARARFVEDLVVEQLAAGVDQYLVLGAGLDSFAERRPDLGDRLRIFEVDQPATQAWKRQRLVDIGHPPPAHLRFVPVDFESGARWWDELGDAGFDVSQPAVVASCGVTMYLTRDATASTLRQLAELAPGSTAVVTFLLPPELIDAEDRQGLDTSTRGARASGTPFVSFYAPDEMAAMCHEAGLTEVRHVSGREVADRYFTGRTDGLRPSSGEDFVVVTIPGG